jgi:hypothetical protein
MKKILHCCTLLIVLAATFSRAQAAPVALPDADMEAPNRDAWQNYGTPTLIEKSDAAHTGAQSLRVVTDNKDAMGGGFEGVQVPLGNFKSGDRVRVSFWLRPSEGREVLVGMGRSSFEQIWRFVDTDWMEAVCDFRVRGDGSHSIWITQNNAANEFLLDDFAVQKFERSNLGIAPVAERVALENPNGRLWFDTKTGALCGIENKITKEIYATLGTREPLFALEVLSADNRNIDVLDFSDARLEKFAANKNKIEMTFRFEKPDVRLLCQVGSTPGGEFVWTAQLENNGAQRVLGLTYPLLQNVRAAREPKNLTLVHPYSCGQIQKDAAKSAGLDAGYPGRAVMGWFDLSGENGGAMLMSQDKTRTGTRLTALPASANEGTFDLSMSKEIALAPKSKTPIAPYALLLHGGDWHIAADAYRAWARSWVAPPDLPRWVREADGWVLIGAQNGIPLRQLSDRFRSAQWMGTEFFNVHGVHTDSMVTDENGKRLPHDMTYLYPNPKLGTPQELKNSVSQIHAQGGRVVFYFLYDRWTPSFESDDNFGGATRSQVPEKFLAPKNFYQTNALVERPGAQPPAQNPPFTVRMMCLASPGWQEWMRFWAIDYYAKEIGADGFYWDVMGRNGPFRCFNANHNHAGENVWARGSAEVLERVTREGREINPEYSSAIEGAQDLLAPWVGFHLMSGATKTPEVVRYTFPELALVDGFSNHIWKWTQVEKARRVFLAGERFDLHGYQAQVRPYVWLRKRLKPFIDWPARFVDTVGVSTNDATVEVRRFVRDDGNNRAVLITILNESKKENVAITAQLGPIEKVISAHTFLPNGAIEPLKILSQEKGVVTFHASAADVSGVLLVEAVEPQLQVVATLDQIRAPGADGLELTAFYPVGKPESFTAKIEAAAGAAKTVRLEETPHQPLSPFVERRTFAPIGGLETINGWEKFNANLSWQAGGKTQTTSAWSLLSPPLSNGGFETLLDNGDFPYWPSFTSVASSENPASGAHCLKLEGDGEKFVHVAQTTPLKPNTRYRISAKIRRDTEKSSARVAVVEYEDSAKFNFSAVIGSGGKAGEWQEFSAEFTSHPDPRNSGVYLYLGNSITAWFDDVSLEEVK